MGGSLKVVPPSHGLEWYPLGLSATGYIYISVSDSSYMLTDD